MPGQTTVLHEVQSRLGMDQAGEPADGVAGILGADAVAVELVGQVACGGERVGGGHAGRSRAYVYVAQPVHVVVGIGGACD